jgi:hypothetical protein
MLQSLYDIWLYANARSLLYYDKSSYSDADLVFGIPKEYTMLLHAEHLDEAQFLDQLTRLVQKGRNGGFLNVSCGPHYFMHLMKNKLNYMRPTDRPMPSHLFWNIASNDTLPDTHALSDLQLAQIRMLGFLHPCSPHPVYDFYATGFVKVLEPLEEIDLPIVARTGCHIFASVFRCPPAARLRFELELYGVR